MSTLALVALEKFGRKVDVGGGERKQSNGCVILVAKGDTDPPVTLQWLQEGGPPGLQVVSRLLRQ